MFLKDFHQTQIFRGSQLNTKIWKPNLNRRFPNPTSFLGILHKCFHLLHSNNHNKNQYELTTERFWESWKYIQILHRFVFVCCWLFLYFDTAVGARHLRTMSSTGIFQGRCFLLCSNGLNELPSSSKNNRHFVSYPKFQFGERWNYITKRVTAHL